MALFPKQNDRDEGKADEKKSDFAYTDHDRALLEEAGHVGYVALPQDVLKDAARKGKEERKGYGRSKL